MNDCGDGVEFSKWYWMPVCLVLLVPLMFVRDMKAFSWTYLFVDIALVISLVMICIYAALNSTSKSSSDV